MKKLLSFLLTASVLLSAQVASAQVNMGIGATAGTDGIGGELGLAIGSHVAIRGGYGWMPGITVTLPMSYAVDSSSPEIKGNVTGQGKLNMSNGRLLVDIFPGKGGFHFTVGAYYAPNNVITVRGGGVDTGEGGSFGPLPTVQSNWGAAYVGFGEGDDFHRLMIDKDGYLNGALRVNALRPYLGIGFGRAISPERRVGFSFDLGVMYWGKPRVTAYDERADEVFTFTSALVENKDNGLIDKYSDWAKYAPVYPVLRFNLFVRLF